MANFLDKIFASKIEVDLVRMDLESRLCFHESRVDSYLATQIAKKNDAELHALFLSYLQEVVLFAEDSELTVQGELDLLERYISLYQHLLGESLFVRLDFKNETEKSIPAFLLFPLIANALQQGYNSMAKFPLKIKIRAYERALQMEVTNHVNHHIVSQEQIALMDYYKNRLIVLYPDRHSLLFNSNSHTFKANLHIQW